MHFLGRPGGMFYVVVYLLFVDSCPINFPTHRRSVSSLTETIHVHDIGILFVISA